MIDEEVQKQKRETIVLKGKLKETELTLVVRLNKEQQQREEMQKTI